MQLLTTRDGSNTLFSEQFNEIYHSLNGAIQESRHVFIESGLKFLLRSGANNFEDKPLKIFEPGFGTGLNAWLTLIESQRNNFRVYYETAELYPLDIGVVKELNYTSLIENEKFRPPFHSLHLCSWNVVHEINSLFCFKKADKSFFDMKLESQQFNLVYFDAFAPETQPEMWSINVMQKMFDCLIPGGVLVSYCSKSTFRRNLKDAGFTVEKLPGPPGKREMVRAHKK